MPKHGTEIGWTHVPGYVGETWNPQVGCSKKSPACDDCYAIEVAAHPRLTRLPRYQGLTVLQQNGRHNWARDAEGKPIIRRVPEVLDKPLRTKRPTAYFVGSMTDLFHENASFNWLAAIFGVMSACPQHIFMLLTKRPDVAARWFEWVAAQPTGLLTIATSASLTCAYHAQQFVSQRWSVKSDAWPLPNVWMGTTCEDQQRAEERLPHLLQIPAAVRYVSYEPAVGPVDFGRWLNWPWWCTRCQVVPEQHAETHLHCHDDGAVVRRTIDWIIVGGESGKRARPAHPEWFRAARDACAAAGVPYFFKQHGEWIPKSMLTQEQQASFWKGRAKGAHGDWGVVRPDGTFFAETTGWNGRDEGEQPDLEFAMLRLGKKAAGRLLDGVEHTAWPEVSR